MWYWHRGRLRTPNFNTELRFRSDLFLTWRLNCEVTTLRNTVTILMEFHCYQETTARHSGVVPFVTRVTDMRKFCAVNMVVPRPCAFPMRHIVMLCVRRKGDGGCWHTSGMLRLWPFSCHESKYVFEMMWNERYSRLNLIWRETFCDKETKSHVCLVACQWFRFLLPSSSPEMKPWKKCWLEGLLWNINFFSFCRLCILINDINGKVLIFSCSKSWPAQF